MQIVIFSPSSCQPLHAKAFFWENRNSRKKVKSIVKLRHVITSPTPTASGNLPIPYPCKEDQSLKLEYVHRFGK